MRVSSVAATVLLITVTACGRSALVKPRSANANNGGNGPVGTGGAGGATHGTGGRAQGTGTGGATVGRGGSPGFGGVLVTGGKVGTGGAGGTAGTDHVGGAVGSGGTSAAGGTRATGGSSGVGGGVGSGGFIHTGGAMATGGVVGVGGITAKGGSMGSGGRVGSGGTTGTGGYCGNGTIGPGEQCDLGVDNKAMPAFWVSQSGQGFAAVPMVGSVSCPYFYSYSSSSAHTGLEAPGTSRILLYIDKTTLALSLAFFHGVDYDSTGLNQPTSHVQMLFSGLPDTTTVGVSDDADELLMTSATTATGFWKFTDNSDGGVLYRFPFPGDWEITIAPSFIDGISTWTWVQSDGSSVNLDLTQPLTIKAYSSTSACRLDCTTPRCGDGILDGGEICDDGSLPKNGCATDCTSFDY